MCRLLIGITLGNGIKTMNWKTVLALLATLLITIIVVFHHQLETGAHNLEAYYSNKFHQAAAKGLYEGFKKTAEKLNRRGPVMQNKHVRFDKAKAGPGARMTNYYTLVDYPSQDINRAKLSANLKIRLVSALCHDNKIKPSLVLGATYTFIYRANDDVEVSHIDVNEHSCDTKQAQISHQ